ncbi:MAG: type II toxin-antitoxin system VapC family toxin [Phycisphaerae bacterium]
MIDGFPAGEACFVDANILGYASIEFVPLTARCRGFLERIASGEILAFTCASAVADALFKTMLTEVARRFVPTGAKVLAFLQSHPEVIGQLSHYPAAAEGLAKLPLRLLPVDWETIRAGARISVQHRLLTHDAMIVALMQRQRLTHLVTNDDDFDSVPGLTVWKPR